MTQKTIINELTKANDAKLTNPNMIKQHQIDNPNKTKPANKR